MLAWFLDGQGVVPENIEEKFEKGSLGAKIITVGLEILGKERKNLFSLPREELLKTKNVQPAILIYDLALAYEHLANGERPDYIAGHSLGEYAAMVIAGILTFEEALRLVISRALFMQECADKYPGKMGVVFNQPLKRVEEICKEISSQEKPVNVANINSSKQITFSGHKEAVNKVIKSLKDLEAKTFILKKVTGAWHSPLMKEAEDKLAQKIKETTFKEIDIPLAVNGLIFENRPDLVKNFLLNQITSPVDFVSTIKTLKEKGVIKVREIGPSDILGKFVQNTVSCVEIL